MKKTWEKPKLIILERGMPEEFVLAGCKVKGSPVTRRNYNTGCKYTLFCLLCRQRGTS